MNRSIFFKFTFIFLLLYSNLLSQNLVPNGGFEEHVGCPTKYLLYNNGHNWNIKLWDTPTYNGTPDYYNKLCHKIFANQESSDSIFYYKRDVHINVEAIKTF